MALCLSVLLEHLVHPVGIIILSRRRIGDTPCRDMTIGIDSRLVTVPVVSSVPGVDVLLIQDRHILLRVEHVDLMDGILPAYEPIVADDGASLLAALGGDEHDTIGRL